MIIVIHQNVQIQICGLPFEDKTQYNHFIILLVVRTIC